MTTHLCTILPFRPRQKPLARAPIDEETIARLGDCEDAAEHARHAVEVEAENARHGYGLVPSGYILSGRALTYALHMLLSLIDLRGNPETDHALSQAARDWLSRRYGGPVR